ncbi:MULTISPECIES: histidine kinase dimerization/phosphoacceptor domain -containing protein [unclassified Sphingomonas]|uniref:sensor histidine kinase n=1 Tax=unclassified Sphingomonas TaxID=196159 RepID=UPI00092B8662|nr:MULTISPECIES: histidine kinase dimerization/phosphoacceptor domain -containing protein [unclassified Sphingomonas]OJU19223.1 MAG: hypothetical protein BGN95_20840 [Sphingomonas sp. 66-10]
MPVIKRPLLLFAGAIALVTAVTLGGLHLAPDRPWLLCIFMALAFTVIAGGAGRGPALAGIAIGALELAFVLPGDGFAVTDPDDALGLIATITLGLIAAWYVGRRNRQRDALAADLAAAHHAQERTAALLRELSHRLANDLAMLVSSTSLMRQSAATPEAVAALDSVASRIVVLSRVYQRLRIEEAERETVEIGAFLGNLCDDMRQSRFNLRPIALHLEIDECRLPLSQAVILGLITNELLTNIAKHAYPDDRPGTVGVRLRPHPFRPDAMQLSVADDGVGYAPPDGDGARMGQRLIAALASQLGGDIAITRREGQTIATLHFPVARMR